MHRIQNNLINFNPQFRANIVGRSATTIAGATKEKFAANAAAVITGATTVTVPAAVVLSQMGNTNVVNNNPEAKTNHEKETPEKPPLPKYAEENKEFLSNSYQKAYLDSHNETLKPEEIESLLRYTENGKNSVNIDCSLLNFNIDETMELLKFPNKDSLGELLLGEIYDNELQKYRKFSFDEIKNILEKYPTINAGVLRSLINDIKIPNIEQGGIRRLTYNEIIQVLDNTKIYNRFLLYNKIKNEPVDIVIHETNSNTEKIPRFIYHLTNKSNYNQMLKEGVISTYSDNWFKNDVICAVELENLFKRWNHSKSWKGSLQQGLIKQVAKKGQDDIVILKIPTSRLQCEQLFIRSQNRLLAAKKYMYQISGEISLSSPYNSKENLTIQDIFDIINQTINQRIANLNNWEHIKYGSPSEQSKLFKQRKEAIEYIYCDNIPMQDVEKIGEVDIGRFRQGNHYDIKGIFDSLLKGTPEAKSTVLLNN